MGACPVYRHMCIVYTMGRVGGNYSFLLWEHWLIRVTDTQETYEHFQTEFDTNILEVGFQIYGFTSVGRGFEEEIVFLWLMNDYVMSD